jgi:hypothetical protein
MIVLLNVASMWLTLSHVQDVLVFNLGLETKNLCGGFFNSSPQSLQADAKIVPEIITPPLASLLFTIYYLLVILLLAWYSVNYLTVS